MESGNSREVATILKQYKFKNGEANFPALFSVPSEERLPALYRNDFLKATGLVVAALVLAFEKMSFKKKIDGVLVNNIAEEILDTCEEDNLSMEDLLLFLQGMVRGKYGNIETLTISRFMGLLEDYREARHLAILDTRENMHLEFKGLGNADKSCKQDALSEHFAGFGGALNTLRENMRELKKENNTLKQIDKF